jgi:hypothetical protein
MSTSQLDKDKNKDMVSIYDYYMALIKTNYPSITENQIDTIPLFKQHLLKLSEYYSIRTKPFEPFTIHQIDIFRKYKVKSQYDNYLFKHFMKNHFFIIEFLNKFDYITTRSITEIDIKDKILSNFYNCLHMHSIDKIENSRLKVLNDYQIISTVCVKERLTYYNFLIDKGLEPSSIKKYINSKYIEIILKSDRPPIFEYQKGYPGEPKDFLDRNIKISDVIKVEIDNKLLNVNS